MLPSGNDASVVLAENFGCLIYFESIGQSKLFEEIHSVDVTEDAYISDYLQLFLQQMNNLCNDFGLKNTKFSNPHGMNNKNNYSTSLDVAKLTFQCLKNEEFRKICSTKSYQATIKFVELNDKVTERNIIWENTNKLLDKGFKGVKTGITNIAGACLSSWYVDFLDEFNKNEQANLIIVVLGSLNQDSRFEDTVKLADWYTLKLKEKYYENYNDH
ncbi:hypothetical protein IMG5_142710 [Ichthyophthirius multifiliis]|uniref:Peptidase S11 D-alanyl-D-alanine carboxypeptidase A N-terminal domain-containing protein n=1 Tax=Ichthyophthirius multifiliis TaxID=5932 RepID=G0QXG0_ICHMU|nr:hypothetical protein IMG5_142710 [Ichthyophthirius multifiliis]EGR30078.1 hypothetical protein IMG5_142710 [Ichthyophthirius multifiliis]|eukprot:XP_004031314.1 hypothetical protein IMG5_142710 [Ichthyophthirius multifiliis]